MDQDEVFRRGEGDRWFERNRIYLEDPKVDWVDRLLETIGGCDRIGSALDLGCANGWRLARLQDRLRQDRPVRCVGVDVSAEAIRDGSRRHPDFEFVRATLSDIPITERFDLVIVNFVLHWVGREHLAKTVAEIDRMVKDNGLLVIGDFLPNAQTRTPYHHLLNQEVYTYKQDYPRLFETFGTYREIARLTFDTDERAYRVQAATGGTRAVCSALRKSLYSYYDAAPLTSAAPVAPPDNR